MWLWEPATNFFWQQESAEDWMKRFFFYHLILKRFKANWALDSRILDSWTLGLNYSGIASAYGTIPHQMMEHCLKLYHIPEGELTSTQPWRRTKIKTSFEVCSVKGRKMGEKRVLGPTVRGPIRLDHTIISGRFC